MTTNEKSTKMILNKIVCFQLTMHSNCAQSGSCLPQLGRIKAMQKISDLPLLTWTHPPQAGVARQRSSYGETRRDADGWSNRGGGRTQSWRRPRVRRRRLGSRVPTSPGSAAAAARTGWWAVRNSELRICGNFSFFVVLNRGWLGDTDRTSQVHALASHKVDIRWILGRRMVDGRPRLWLGHEVGPDELSRDDCLVD